MMKEFFKDKKMMAGTLVILAIGAIFALDALGIVNIDWSFLRGTSSGEAIERAFENTLSATSYGFEITATGEIIGTSNLIEGSADNGSPKEVVSAIFNMKGSVDQTDKNVFKQQSEISINLGTEGIEVKADGDLITIGKDNHLKVNSFPPILGTTEGLIGTWYLFNPNDIKNQLQASSSQPIEEQISEEQAKQLIQEITTVIKNKGLFEIKRTLGADKTASGDAKHYSVIINKNAAKKIMPEILKIMANYIPETDKNEYLSNLSQIEKELPQVIDDFFKKTGGISFDAWVKDEKLVKIAWSKKIDLSKIESLKDKVKEGSLKLGITIDYYDFNKGFTIEKPAQSKPFIDYLNSLNQEPATSTLSTSTLGY